MRLHAEQMRPNALLCARPCAKADHVGKAGNYGKTAGSGLHHPSGDQRPSDVWTGPFLELGEKMNWD